MLTATTPSDVHKRPRGSSPEGPLPEGPLPGESPLTSRAVRQRTSGSASSSTAASVVSPTAVKPPSRPFEESWKQCSDALHAALGAMPYGDVPPMTDKPPMSVEQLLAWGDKFTRGEESSHKAPPVEQVFMRWTSHTLTCLADVNKTRADIRLRALSDGIKQSPPDSSWLPSHLLLRHGPDALLQQLHMLPPAVVAANLSDFDGWKRSAASLEQLSNKITGWEKLLGVPSSSSSSSSSSPDHTSVPTQPMAEPPPALNGSGGGCCHCRGLIGDLAVSQKDGAATPGGTESKHWQILVSVRNVARAPRTVSRLVVAEEPPRPPTSASVVPTPPETAEAEVESGDGGDGNVWLGLGFVPTPPETAEAEVESGDGGDGGGDGGDGNVGDEHGHGGESETTEAGHDGDDGDGNGDDDDERAAERTELLRWLCSRQFEFTPPVELKAGGFFGGGGEVMCSFKMSKADDNPSEPLFAVLEIDADAVPSERIIAREWTE